jgi:hypothetical protein
MNSGPPFTSRRILLVFLALGALAVITLLAVNRVVSSQQQDQTPGNPSSQGATARERKIGVGIPKHLPLKFEVKNLNSERWVYDLEINVTNTSTKPIYFLDFFITVPGYINKSTGNKLGFWFRYGRIELISFRSLFVLTIFRSNPAQRILSKYQRDLRRDGRINRKEKEELNQQY